MHKRSLSELQGVTPHREPVTPRTSLDRSSWSPRVKREFGVSAPLRGAPLWAWLLLGALVVPGSWSYLNEEQEELIVELHNHYRGQVSPSASAMLPLKWDPNLKVLAESYAAKCVWNHNPELTDTGENLFAGTGPLNLGEALEKWFLEHLDYNYHNNSCDEDKMCGHYTQMVWADTHRVGCAFHLCNTMEGLDWERVSFLVCNYYPAGNYEGELPYVEGDWCSSCPENLQKCENNLCVAETEEEGDLEEGTFSPSLQPDEFIAFTSDTPVQPAITSTHVSTVPFKLSPNFIEDTPPLATTTEATQVPDALQTTLGYEENVDILPTTMGYKKAEVDKNVDLREVEQKKKGTQDDKKEEFVIDKAQDVPTAKMGAVDSGSASSPLVLLVWLTAILTVRLWRE
ncbi:uncharacterized protein KZ484_015644 [Pholidichthys leucotaenia]